jgi:hypothetical protein
VAASVRQRIAFGERAGEKVRRVGHGFGYEGEQPELKGMRCATVNGFSLHANTDVAAHRRDQLERLLRYTARGAVSLERLAQDASGDLLYPLPVRGLTVPLASNCQRLSEAARARIRFGYVELPVLPAWCPAHHLRY